MNFGSYKNFPIAIPFYCDSIKNRPTNRPFNRMCMFFTTMAFRTPTYIATISKILNMNP